jgi:N-acetylmuramoyl-L-alanine amidase
MQFKRFKNCMLACLLCFGMIAFPVITYAEAAYLTNIRVIKADKLTRVIFSLTQSAPQQMTLLGPDRIAVDFDNTQLAEHLKNLRLPTDEVQAIKSENLPTQKLRLILVVKANANAVMMPKAQSNRYVLDIDTKNVIKMGSEKISRVISTPVFTSIMNVKPVLQASKKHYVTTIVIDAGHGGKDPGAVGARGIKEKEVVLAIAKKLAEYINQQPNMHAVLTRDGDYFVPLRDRLKLARKGKADLFMSIHADSYFNNSATGASVYTLSHRGATSEAARWLAKRENDSELGGADLNELGSQNVLLRSVLIDLAQAATTTDSLRLGSSILNAFDVFTKLSRSRVEQAPFVVLKSPDIPSVLVETGYISNPHEELRLRDAKYQAQLARALFNGIHSYLKKYPTG